MTESKTIINGCNNNAVQEANIAVAIAADDADGHKAHQELNWPYLYQLEPGEQP